jgi:hypothetical protein
MMTMLMGVLLCFLGAFHASAAVVSQCEAVADRVLVNADGYVLSWISLREGAAWGPAIAGATSWGLPALETEGITFDTPGAPASPFCSSAGAVSTLFIVACPAESSNHFAALVEAPGAAVTVAARALPLTYDPEDAEGLSVRVNGQPVWTFPDGRHIVEVDFAQAVPGCDLRIGGVSACAAWRQSWCGHISEVVAFDTSPDEAVRRTVRSYLARRHGVAGYFPPPGPEAVLQAMSLGLYTHALFSTQLFMR